ncbi:hypothetical protein PCURB6_34290 [Paenibacillus curdlanolyticus]|nr:hypothetical protein PCURB6_34290 [Paenibacillus curdlanolyticus]
MKKVAALWCSLILVMALLLDNITVSAASTYDSIDSIKLQQSPYAIGEGWTVDLSYSNSAPYALIKGKNEYMAVGPYGTVMKSTDGRNWKTLTKFGNYQLTTIAWNGSKYLLFGTNTQYDNEAQYSPSEAFMSADGKEWTKIDFEPGEAIHYAVWGKNEFVAVGREHVYTSSDGIKWTKTFTHPVSYGYHPIEYVHDTYFLYGFEDNKVYTSKDGRKWTGRARDTKANIISMIWANNQYIGVGNGIYTSADGVSWKKQSNSPSGVNLRSIVTDGTMYIAEGYLQANNQQVSYTSRDGVKWSKHSLPNLNLEIYSIYPVNGGFAGIGSNESDGTYSFYTKDGVKWSYKLIGTPVVGEFTGIATNGKRTVAVGYLGSVVYTDNGTVWRSAQPFAYTKNMGRTNLFDVAWGANKFVAVGNGGVYTSSDGVSWSKQKVAFKDAYGSLQSIKWTGKVFVASDQGYGVYASKDGITWTKATKVSKSGYWLTSMVTNGTKVVGAFQIYNNGKPYTQIMQTTNGIDWTTAATLNSRDVDLAWNGQSYIAVNPYNPALLWTSKDAKKWSKAKVNLDQNDHFQFTTSFDGYFFAFNDSLKKVNGNYETYIAYYVSKNGTEWKEIKVPDKQNVETFGDQMVIDGVKAHGYYIFVGGSGQIMYNKQLQF